MFRRSAANVFALVIAFILGAALTSRPLPVSAQPAVGGHGKCVAVAAVNDLVYRAFEDGTVERAIPNSDSKWSQIGK
jgi:hypothetical protein